VVPGAPTIRVRGFGVFGGIDVRSKARKDAPSPAPSTPTLGTPPAIDASSRPAPATQPLAGLVTIVCTDLVGSTRLSDQLGDQRWREVLLAHHRVVRAELARHGGQEVKTVGDGFLCTFTSARSAVAFAVDLQGALDDGATAQPLEVRVGIHAGEVERDGDDLVGRNVSVACRLCDVASPGEVLASGVVADLADSASDLVFGEGRVVRLAGIDRDVVARAARRT